MVLIYQWCPLVVAVPVQSSHEATHSYQQWLAATPSEQQIALCVNRFLTALAADAVTQVQNRAHCMHSERVVQQQGSCGTNENRSNLADH